MIRLLHLEIHDTCEDCPYFERDWDNNENICNNISNYTKCICWIDTEASAPTIPDWCPLPEYVEGGKF